jgi:hypothetical protein
MVDSMMGALPEDQILEFFQSDAASFTNLTSSEILPSESVLQTLTGISWILLFAYHILLSETPTSAAVTSWMRGHFDISEVYREWKKTKKKVSTER